MVKKKWLWLSLSMGLLGTLCYFFSFVSNADVKNHTEKELHKLEHKAAGYLDSIYEHLHHSPKKAFVNYLAASYQDTYNQEGIACFIYENDSLLYWTDSRVAVENYMLNVCLEKRLVKLKNGFYEVIRHPKNVYSPFQLYALVLIKNAFPYENKYLKNDFNKNLSLGEEVFLNEGEAPAYGISISNFQGQTVFNFELLQQVRRQTLSLISFLLFFAAIFSALYCCGENILRKHDRAAVFKLFACLMGGSFILWMLLFVLNVLYIPVSKTDDFNGFLWLVYEISVILISLWFILTARKFSFPAKPDSLSTAIIFSAATYVLGLVINYLIAEIFNVSNLSADLADVVFSFSIAIYLSYIFIFLLLFCFVAFSELIFNYAGFVFSKKYIITLGLITSASLVVHHFLGKYDLLTAVWPGLFFVLLWAFRKLCAGNKFLFGILVCLFISFFSAFLSIDRKGKTDYVQRMNLARQLASSKDEIAEHLFHSVRKAVLTDKEVMRIILKKDKSAGDVEQYILRKYFNGYWDKYHISICVFDSLCFPIVPHVQHLYNNNSYFDDLIATKLKPADGNGLYFNEQLKDKTFYLFKSPLETTRKPHFMYVVIESKNTPEYRGFPDLLLSRSLLTINADYSYAIYKAGQIYNKQGRFEYPNYFSYPDDKQDNWVFQQDGYSHLVYKPDANTKIIVSKAYSYFNDLFSTIGFLFLAGSTVFLLFSFVISFTVKNENSLAGKIQRYAAFGIFVLFLPVAISTIALVKKQTDKQNTDAIKDKAQTLGNYLSVRLADYDTLNKAHKDYVSYLLAQASGLFKSDLTLFYTNGEYYTTSLPKLFDEGLISKKLNPHVYANILSTSQNKDVVNESIGSLNFYSAYSLVKNKSGHTLCIVNLPYFSRQNELQAQLFGYLSALLNIYILAFMVVSVGLALLANWLTRPLRELQNQFMQIGLNRQDHSIKYNRNDEIGVLISAYNTMLLQLRESAEKLAQSEREGAWKEMARQVAHEIKNPLTPMKLSIQHVQRLMETDPKAAAEHIKKINPILLEQIDALSHIATEFSNFWQLPAPKFETIELVGFINSLLPLYDNDPEISFRVNTNEKQAFVKADKDQLLRVMNNLVNNAVQALDGNSEIKLGLEKENNKYVISVTDNGKGIDDNLKGRIFQPNFSTKSYGTGLGLAMCKRIIEQHGGKIWFESENGKGTSFYFSISAA
jgi:two-component system, NtrC family, nitrogen regulation sensor histidine kinase NtrY